MDVLLLWILGGFIGLWAANKRGFSPNVGFFVGVLLGPVFAWAMFLAKGQGQPIRPADSKPPEFVQGSWRPIIIGVVSVIAIVFIIALAQGPSRYPADGSPPAAATITMDKFLALDEGMTYADVVRILGRSGEEISRTEIGDLRTVMYQWQGPGISSMNAMFQNGKLISKAQFGLE